MNRSDVSNLSDFKKYINVNKKPASFKETIESRLKENGICDSQMESIMKVIVSHDDLSC